MARSRTLTATTRESVRPLWVLPRGAYDECRSEELDPPMLCACCRCRPQGWCTACLSELKAVRSGALAMADTGLDNGNPQPVGVFRVREKETGDHTLCLTHNAQKYDGCRIDAPGRGGHPGFAKARTVVPLDFKSRAAGSPEVLK